jgi:diguanylate cyclase (GGDEF)-like protein/PAS domain S-box-containing protein
MTLDSDLRGYRFWLLNAGLATGYWGLVEITGRLFAAYGLFPAPVWPAAALAFVGVWRFGRAAWVGIVIGATLANWFYPPNPPPFWAALIIALGSLTGAAVANRILQFRCGKALPFDRLSHTLLFLACMVLILPIIAASIGTSAVTLSCGWPVHGVFNGWLKWMIADAVGALIFAPLVMVLLRPQPVSLPPLLPLETPLAMAITFALSMVVYWLANAETYAVYALPYLLVMPLAWVALRFPLIRAIQVLLIHGLTAFSGTLLGLGSLNAIVDPYPIGTLGLILVCSFFGVHMANALMTELRQQQQALRESNSRLEDKVRDRTRELASSEARFRNYFNMGQIGMAEAGPDRRWVRVNNHLCQMLGYDADEMIGRPWPEWVHPDDLAANAVKSQQLLNNETDNCTAENRIRHRDGRYVPTIMSVQAEYRADGAIDYFFLAIQDINERKTMEEELQRRATIDALTGVSNRQHFTDLAEKEIARAHRHGNALCFLMFDVDHFKQVNDNFGHPTGDAVLEALTNHCQESLRSFDIIGRVGGEEFAVLLPNTGLNGAVDLADRMRQAIAAKPMTDLKGVALPPVTISIGVAMLRPDERLAQLFSRADTALYRAKGAGRNRVEVAPE